MDIETLLERLENLASNKRGISWEMAEVAYDIVGKRIPGATKQAALVCGIVSPDAVEHWAKAYRLYRVLFRYESGAVNKYTDWFRDELSVSHFYTMWELGQKHKISIPEICIYFYTLIGHKRAGNSWSVAALKAEVDADYPNGNAVDYRWHISRIQKNIDALLTFGELPIPWRAWARMYKGLRNKVK